MIPAVIALFHTHLILPENLVGIIPDFLAHHKECRFCPIFIQYIEQLVRIITRSVIKSQGDQPCGSGIGIERRRRIIDSIFVKKV